MRAFMKKPHSKKCNYATAGRLAEAMCHLPEYQDQHFPDEVSTYQGDKLGRRTGGWSNWQVWICNDTDCPARGIVSADDLTELGSAALAEGPS